MDSNEANEMRCPSCGFIGPFKKARPRFLVFDLWHWLVERNAARRSFVCPKCGTKVTLLKGSWIPYAIMILILLTGLFATLVASQFLD
jgi:DNA-directed RNA polymerase subunit RPC12/RpoP